MSDKAASDMTDEELDDAMSHATLDATRNTELLKEWGKRNDVSFTTKDAAVNKISNWSVGNNMPGYMPEGDGYITDDWESARSALVDDLDRAADSLSMGEVSEEDINAYNTAIAEVKALAPNTEWGDILPSGNGSEHDLGQSYWLNQTDEEPDDDDGFFGSLNKLEQREREVIHAMANCTDFRELKKLDAELVEVRAARRAQRFEAAEVEFSGHLVQSYLAPVLVHEHHTAATDWIDDLDPTPADLAPLAQRAAAEATVWFEGLHEAVKYDPEELATQADGISWRFASQFGEQADAVRSAFLEHLGHLAKQANALMGYPDQAQAPMPGAPGMAPSMSGMAPAGAAGTPSDQVQDRIDQWSTAQPTAAKSLRRTRAVNDIYDFPEGTTAVCVQCGEPILLDQREGGGPGKDWGARPEDWVGNGGIGMDYGCAESPLNDHSDGTGGHSPKAGTIQPPAKTAKTAAEIHDYDEDHDGGDNRFGGEDPYDTTPDLVPVEGTPSAQEANPVPGSIPGTYPTFAPFAPPENHVVDDGDGYHPENAAQASRKTAEKYDEYVSRRKSEHGDKFDESDMAKKFIPHYNSGQRIKVRTSYGDEITGTVGATTGWKPSFMLMRRSNAHGSSDLLSDKDEIIGLHNGRGYDAHTGGKLDFDPDELGSGDKGPLDERGGDDRLMNAEDPDDARGKLGGSKSVEASFYVHRRHPETGRQGWVGPIRSEQQANKEKAAWEEAGHRAEVHPSSPEVKSRVRQWQGDVKERLRTQDPSEYHRRYKSAVDVPDYDALADRPLVGDDRDEWIRGYDDGSADRAAGATEPAPYVDEDLEFAYNNGYMTGFLGRPATASRRTAEDKKEDTEQSGQGGTSLDDVEVGDPNDKPAWDWELATKDTDKGQNAADVKSVSTPGGESGYPQPTGTQEQHVNPWPSLSPDKKTDPIVGSRRPFVRESAARYKFVDTHMPGGSAGNYNSLDHAHRVMDQAVGDAERFHLIDKQTGQVIRKAPAPGSANDMSKKKGAKTAGGEPDWLRGELDKITDPTVRSVMDESDWYDPWGSTMSWLFSMADWLTDHPEGSVPDELGYQRGMGGSDEEAPEYEALQEINASPAAVQQASLVLNDISDRLKAEGRDY